MIDKKINAGVVKDRGADGEDFYRVREIVNNAGNWIDWPGIYSSADAAYAEIRRVQNNQR